MTPNPRIISLLHILLLACAVPLSFLACGQRGDNNLADNTTAYPPPGEMRIVSITPIPPQTVVSDNLIVNGSTIRWWAGAPAPEGWHRSARSKDPLTRQLNNTGDGFCVRQTWLTSSKAKGIRTSSYLETVDLEPNKRYRLSVTGAIITGEQVTIDIFELVEDDWTILHSDFIVLDVNDGKVTQSTRDFTSGDGLRLAVCPRAEVIDGAVVTVDWYAWSIVKISDDAATTQGYSETHIVLAPAIPEAPPSSNDPQNAP